MEPADGASESIEGLPTLGRRFQSDELKADGRSPMVHCFPVSNNRIQDEWRFARIRLDDTPVCGAGLDVVGIGHLDSQTAGGEVFKLAVAHGPSFGGHTNRPYLSPESNRNDHVLWWRGPFVCPALELLDLVRPTERDHSLLRLAPDGFEGGPEHALLVT